MSSRCLQGPLLVVPAAVRPQMYERAVRSGDTTHIQARTGGVRRGDSIVAAAGCGERKLLVRGDKVLPELHLRTVGRGRAANFNRSPALHTHDGILIVATVGDGPALIIAAAVAPLNDLRAVGRSVIGSIHRFAAMARDHAIGAIGDGAPAGSHRSCRGSPCISWEPAKIRLRALTRSERAIRRGGI